MFVIAYLNNILIYLENKEDYIKHVKTVLKYLNSYSLQLKPLKCKFY
jgi:hypothetical protein